MEEKQKGILKSAAEIQDQAKVAPPVRWDEDNITLFRVAPPVRWDEDNITLFRVAPPVRWDEDNITLTLHPVGKDYGHMKIEEPKTPYEYYNGSDDEMGDNVTDEPWTPPNELDANELQTTLENIDWSSRQLKFEEQAERMSLEETKAKKNFASKRSAHYNEFQAMKEARATGLLDDNSDEEEEEEENGVVETEKMETDELPIASSTLEIKEPKPRRRVSISSDASEGKHKDPAKISDFEKKRKAHYTGEFKRAVSADK